MSDTNPKHAVLIAGLIAERVLNPSEKALALGILEEHGQGVFDGFIEARKRQLATLQTYTQTEVARRALAHFWTGRNGHGATEKGV